MHCVCCAAPLVLCVRCRTALSGAALLGAVLRTALCVPRRTARVGSGQRTAKLLQCNASMLAGSGQWSSCFAPPHCLKAVGCGTPAFALPHCSGAVGSGTPAMHCLTAQRQWAAQLLWCNATLLVGSKQWSSCFAPPQCMGAVGCGTPLRTASLPGGSGDWNSCHALPHCLGAVGSATPAMHCLSACGQWAVELLLCTATRPRGNWL